MKSFIWLYVLLFVTTLSAQTSKIEWADNVEEFSSQRDTKQYAAIQVLGEPNAFPNGGDSPASWSASKPENKKEEFIKVSFKERFNIQQIVVAQNFNPGAIQQIYLFNTNDRAFLVYDVHKDANVNTKNALFTLILPEITLYKVRALKIILNTKLAEGYNSIDAIGISDAKHPIQIGVEIDQNATFLSEPENLGSKVNSVNDDYIPQISPDGKDLYFARKDKESVTIYNSKVLPDGKWSEANRMSKPLNNQNDNFVYTITPDGNTLLLGDSYNEQGSNLGAAISLKNGKSWETPKSLVINQLVSASNYNEFFLGPNKKVLLMTLQNNESFGETDVFVSFLGLDKTWSKPQNLGNVINTADVEASPFLAADNRTLFFASKGHRGYGKTDIFVSKRIGEGWDNWSKPLNLGKVINTEEAEYYYSVPASGEYAYYVSKNNTFGASDIFRVKLPNSIKPKAVTLIYGNVYNAKTKEPLSAEILYELLPEGMEAGLANSNSEDGSYKIVLPIDEKYGFLAYLDGFMSLNEYIDLKTSGEEYTEIRKDLYLIPLEKGQLIRLNNVSFERSKFDLEPSSKPELNRLIAIMQKNPKMMIKLNGHTDNRGNAALNKELSENRVNEVKKYLVANGVDSKRIETEGWGSSQPLNQNLTEDERSANRRVELEILNVE